MLDTTGHYAPQPQHPEIADPHQQTGLLALFFLRDPPCDSEEETAAHVRRGIPAAAHALQNRTASAEAAQALVHSLWRSALSSAKARREFAQAPLVVLRDPAYREAHQSPLFRDDVLAKLADLASRHDDCRRILLGIGPQALPTLLETAPETARALARTLCASAAPSWDHQSICHYQEVVVAPTAGPADQWSVLIMQNNKPPLALIGPHAGPLSTLEQALQTGNDTPDSWQVLQTFRKISAHRRDLPTLISTIRPPSLS